MRRDDSIDFSLNYQPAPHDPSKFVNSQPFFGSIQLLIRHRFVHAQSYRQRLIQIL